MRLVAQLLPIRNGRDGLFPLLAEERRRILQRTTQLHVRKRGFRVLFECLTAEMIHLTIPPDASRALWILYARVVRQSASNNSHRLKQPPAHLRARSHRSSGP